MNSLEKKIMKILNEHGKMLKEHKKSLDKIEKIISKKSELISQSYEPQKSNKTKSTKSAKSISGFIKGFAEEGFFDTPKTLKEISEELARNGYHYRTTSLTHPLRNLLRKRFIGRIVVNGQWAYVKR